MTQFNTSLEGGSPQSDTRIRSAPETPQVPEIGSPSYRESFIPIHASSDTSGVRMAAELQRDLALAGHAIGSLGDFAERDRNQQARMQTRKDALNDRVAAKQDTADRIAASSAMAVDVPSTKGKIDEGKAGYQLLPGETPEEGADRILHMVRGEGLTDGFRKLYDPRFKGEIIGHLYQQEEKVKHRNAQDLVKYHSGAAGIAAQNPGELEQAVGSMKDATSGLVSEDMIRASVFGGAANDVALSGGATIEDRKKAVERFDMIEKAAGPELSVPMQIMRNRLTTTLDKQQTAANKNFFDSVATRGMEGVGDDQGVPGSRTVQIRMAQDDARTFGAEPHALKAAINRINEGAAAEAVRARSDAVRMDLNAKMSGYSEEVYQRILSASTSGGVGLMDLDGDNPRTITDLDGKEHPVPMKRFAVDGMLRAIQNVNPNVPMDVLTPERVRLQMDNNTAFPPYRSLLQSGGNITPTQAMYDKDANGRPKFSAATISAFSLARQADQQDKTGKLLEFLVGDPKKAQFYTSALLARKFMPEGANDQEKDVNAIQRAAMGLKNTLPLPQSDDVTINDQIHAGLSSLSGASNFPEIRGEARRLAEFLARSSGAPVDAAATAAVQKIASRYRMANGMAVDTGSGAMPKDAAGNELFPAFADRYIDRYMESVGNKAGLHKSDVGIIPSNAENTFLLYNNKTLELVPGWRNGGPDGYPIGWFNTSNIVREAIERQRGESNRHKSMIDEVDANSTPDHPGGGGYAPGGPYGDFDLGYSGPATGYREIGGAPSPGGRK